MGSNDFVRARGGARLTRVPAFTSNATVPDDVTLSRVEDKAVSEHVQCSDDRILTRGRIRRNKEAYFLDWSIRRKPYIDMCDQVG